MALRVLLADESSTIKKVFQLALQDFAVEVRPVNIGVDVSAVAKAFKPDIIFADVMLQKKNGYDVCAELKQDKTLKAIPFVLMWSGFVELDEDKFQASQANAQLEKPFDVAALRKLVSDLVPRTKNQNLSQYLTFPKGEAEVEPPRPDFQEKTLGDKSIHIGEEFTQVPITKAKPGRSNDKYRLDLKPEELDPAHIAVDYSVPSDQINVDDLFKTQSEPEEFAVRDIKKPGPPVVDPPPLIDMPPPPPIAAAPKPKEKPPEFELELAPEELLPDNFKNVPKFDDATVVTEVTSLRVEPAAPAPKQEALSAEALEQIVRAQSAEVIESVVWKVIPELAAQIIERELQKLLKERDSNPY